MLHITDDMVEAALTPADVEEALTAAFRSFAAGNGGMQERVRTYGGGVRLSTMGAVLPDQEIAGAKIYTTIDGAFTFAIVLFSTTTGALLATFDANAITGLRTAACSVLAARHLARADSATLAIFGVGVQGRAHATQFARAFPVRDILLVSQRDDPAIAAVGSSLPTSRELDDAALVRASRIAVEWRTQSLREAGELVLAAPGTIDPDKIVELGELVAGTAPGRTADDEITLYKSVGVGLEDVAIAGLAYRRIAAD